MRTPVLECSSTQYTSGTGSVDEMVNHLNTEYQLDGGRDKTDKSRYVMYSEYLQR